MGVLPRDTNSEQPRTPSEDDLYSDTGDVTTTTFDNDFRSDLPILSAKGIFEDFLGGNYWNTPNERKYCGKCYEDVRSDLKKLAEVVDGLKNERDVAKKETAELRKEVEELKNLLKKTQFGDVKVSVVNGKDNFDVILRSDTKANDVRRKVTRGISSFSISLPKEKPEKSTLPSTKVSDLSPKVTTPPTPSVTAPSTPDVPAITPEVTSLPEVKPKKTIAELRREFFARELESEQTTFTSYNYIQIKPEEKEEIFRSKINIRVKPKRKIFDVISKLTGKVGPSKVIPDPTPVCMFQRFEKSKTLWVSEFEQVSL